MKYVKMLGLAAVAVAALMAFVGASSASATILCSVEGGGTPTGTTCPNEKAYPEKTEIHAVNEGNAVLTTGSEFTEITCTESTVKGKTTNEGSATETVKGTIETLTFGNCSTPNGKCTVTTVKGGTLEVHWVNTIVNGVEKGSHEGTVTSSGAEVTSNCASIFGNIHCIYTTNATDIGMITGGVMAEGKATMDIESAPIKGSPTNALCPETSAWDAKYEVTTPKPLFVASHT